MCFYWFWRDPNWQSDLQDLFHSSEFYVTAKIIIVFHFPSPSHWQISRIGQEECSLPLWELSSNKVESRSVNTLCSALSPLGHPYMTTWHHVGHPHDPRAPHCPVSVNLGDLCPPGTRDLLWSPGRPQRCHRRRSPFPLVPVLSCCPKTDLWRSQS